MRYATAAATPSDASDGFGGDKTVDPNQVLSREYREGWKLT